MADEKLIRLKSCTVESNFEAHMRTEEVLAVPEPPIKRQPFWTKAVAEWMGLGWVKTELTMYSVLHESRVGSKSCENLTPFDGSGFHFSGVIILYSTLLSSICK